MAKRKIQGDALLELLARENDILAARLARESDALAAAFEGERIAAQRRAVCRRMYRHIGRAFANALGRVYRDALTGKRESS